MPADYVIDKDIATLELLSHVLVSKYADHLPLYRQRLLYQRAGYCKINLIKMDWSMRCAIRTFSSGAEADCITQQVIHADETP